MATSPVPPLPAIEFGHRSDPGRDPEKQVNEDVYGKRETPFGHLCVVCDGMGGHAAGREAAELALGTVFEVFDAAPADRSPADVLRSALEEANRRVHVLRTSEIGFGHPGSTAVAVLLHAGGTEVAHVGDSRAYLVHAGQISRLTRDHSLVQELVDRGLLTAYQAAHHPDANRITRALGIAADVEVDVRPEPVAHVAGDAFVLCSDGLSDLVEEDEILSIVGDEPPAQAVGKLVDLANARGGHDNITVLVLRARESAAAGAHPVAPTVAQTAVTQPLAVASSTAGSSAPAPRGPSPAAAGATFSAATPPRGTPSKPAASNTMPAPTSLDGTASAPASNQASAPPPTAASPAFAPRAAGAPSPAGAPRPPAASPSFAPSPVGAPRAVGAPRQAGSGAPRSSPMGAPPFGGPPGPPSPTLVDGGPPGAKPRPRVSGAAATAPGVRASPIVLAALALAAIAAVLLGGVLVRHLAELRGKRNPHGETPAGGLDGDGGPARSVVAAPTTLAPERVVIPATSSPAGEPLAPLEPATTGDVRKGRKDR